jgi:hypothetical protein
VYPQWQCGAIVERKNSLILVALSDKELTRINSSHWTISRPSGSRQRVSALYGPKWLANPRGQFPIQQHAPRPVASDIDMLALGRWRERRVDLIGAPWSAPVAGRINSSLSENC